VKINPQFVGSLGYLKEFKKIQLAVLSTAHVQGKYSTIGSQLFAQYKFVKLGLGHLASYGSYQNLDKFTGCAGVQFNSFLVGYSYQSVDDNKYKYYRGSHEITAAYYIKGLNRDKGMSRFMNAIL